MLAALLCNLDSSYVPPPKVVEKSPTYYGGRRHEDARKDDATVDQVLASWDLLEARRNVLRDPVLPGGDAASEQDGSVAGLSADGRIIHAPAAADEMGQAALAKTERPMDFMARMLLIAAAIDDDDE